MQKKSSTTPEKKIPPGRPAGQQHTEPIPSGQVGRETSSKQPPSKSSANRSSSAVRVLAKPANEQALVNVSGEARPASAAVVDTQSLQEFARRHAPKPTRLTRQRSSVTKKQLIVAALVLAMLLSLAALLAIAMKLTSRDDPKKASLRFEPPIVMTSSTSD